MSKIEEFIDWIESTVEAAIPSNPDKFTRKQLVDYAQDVLWSRMEERGGIIPADDSLDNEEDSAR